MFFLSSLLQFIKRSAPKVTPIFKDMNLLSLQPFKFTTEVAVHLPPCLISIVVVP